MVGSDVNSQSEGYLPLDPPQNNLDEVEGEDPSEEVNNDENVVNS